MVWLRSEQCAMEETGFGWLRRGAAELGDLRYQPHRWSRKWVSLARGRRYSPYYLRTVFWAQFQLDFGCREAVREPTSVCNTPKI